MSVRHPVRLTVRAGQVTPGLGKCVGLARRPFCPHLDGLAILGTDLILVVDVNLMPENPMDDPMQRHLTHARSFWPGGSSSSGMATFPCLAMIYEVREGPQS